MPLTPVVGQQMVLMDQDDVRAVESLRACLLPACAPFHKHNKGRKQSAVREREGERVNVTLMMVDLYRCTSIDASINCRSCHWIKIGPKVDVPRDCLGGSAVCAERLARKRLADRALVGIDRGAQFTRRYSHAGS